MERSWGASRLRLPAAGPLARLAAPWLLLLAGCGLVVGIAALLTEEPPLAEVSLAYLEGDPLPVHVIRGTLDDRFEPVRGNVIHQLPPGQGWWRIRVHGDVPAEARPQLQLLSARAADALAWLAARPGEPGDGFGRRVTGLPSPRALVLALDSGVQDGDTVYLQVRSPPGNPMRVRVDPLAAVHQADLVHVGWRSAGLAGLVMLSVLALGMWGAVGEMRFGLLALALASQALYFAASGGEAHLWSATAWLSRDIRLVHLTGVLALLANIGFASRYLRLEARRPRVTLVLRVLAASAAVLAVAMLLAPRGWMIAATSALAALMILVVLSAAVVDGMRGRQAALFLLAGWVPMTLLLLGHLAELSGSWLGPPWMGHALPASCALSGLVVTVGLGGIVRTLRRERDDASHRASYDALTGALSRSAIEARLAHAVRSAHVSGSSLSVVFFDIDHFKRVNDQYGHLVGDECIRIVALRTRNRLRTYDLFGRWGGDEILVLLPDTPLDEAVGVAENLRSAVNSRALEIDGRMLAATVSLGVAQLAYGEQANELVRRADAALYASKQDGRDRVSISRWATLQDPSPSRGPTVVPAPAADRS